MDKAGASVRGECTLRGAFGVSSYALSGHQARLVLEGPGLQPDSNPLPDRQEPGEDPYRSRPRRFADQADGPTVEPGQLVERAVQAAQDAVGVDGELPD